jgi:ferritin-like metal-binding protein YciE
MPIQNPQELFVWMLSDCRRREERGKIVFDELSKVTEDPELKEILETWSFLKDKTVSTIDHCFKLMNKQPVETRGRIHDAILEDIRNDLSVIQNPMVKTLYVAHKIAQMMRLQATEYLALTTMADVTGHYAIGALVETCLADYMAFAERAKRRVGEFIDSQITMRRAA